MYPLSPLKRQCKRVSNVLQQSGSKPLLTDFSGGIKTEERAPGMMQGKPSLFPPRPSPGSYLPRGAVSEWSPLQAVPARPGLVLLRLFDSEEIRARRGAASARGQRRPRLRNSRVRTSCRASPPPLPFLIGHFVCPPPFHWATSWEGPRSPAFHFF